METIIVLKSTIQNSKQHLDYKAIDSFTIENKLCELSEWAQVHDPFFLELSTSNDTHQSIEEKMKGLLEKQSIVVNYDNRLKINELKKGNIYVIIGKPLFEKKERETKPQFHISENEEEEDITNIDPVTLKHFIELTNNADLAPFYIKAGGGSLKNALAIYFDQKESFSIDKLFLTHVADDKIHLIDILLSEGIVDPLIPRSNKGYHILFFLNSVEMVELLFKKSENLSNLLFINSSGGTNPIYGYICDKKYDLANILFGKLYERLEKENLQLADFESYEILSYFFKKESRILAAELASFIHKGQYPHMITFMLSLNHFSLNSPSNILKETCLHVAIRQGDLETASKLLQHGADPNAENFFRQTSGHYANMYLSIEQKEALFKLEQMEAMDLLATDEWNFTMQHSHPFSENHMIINPKDEYKETIINVDENSIKPTLNAIKKLKKVIPPYTENSPFAISPLYGIQATHDHLHLYYIKSDYEPKSLSEEQVFLNIIHIISCVKLLHDSGLVHGWINNESYTYMGDTQVVLSNYGTPSHFLSNSITKYHSLFIPSNQKPDPFFDSWSSADDVYALSVYLLEELKSKEIHHPAQNSFLKLIELCFDQNPHMRPTVQHLYDESVMLFILRFNKNPPNYDFQFALNVLPQDPIQLSSREPNVKLFELLSDPNPSFEMSLSKDQVSTLQGISQSVKDDLPNALLHFDSSLFCQVFSSMNVKKRGIFLDFIRYCISCQTHLSQFVIHPSLFNQIIDYLKDDQVPESHRMIFYRVACNMAQFQKQDGASMHEATSCLLSKMDELLLIIDHSLSHDSKKATFNALVGLISNLSQFTSLYFYYTPKAALQLKMHCIKLLSSPMFDQEKLLVCMLHTLHRIIRQTSMQLSVEERSKIKHLGSKDSNIWFS